MRIPICHFAVALSLVACGQKETEEASDRIAISVEPLSLEGVDEATYTLRVFNGAVPPGLVWERTGLASTRYGDGRGALTYVGPCDASTPTNRVELVLEGLEANGAPIALDSYVNPAPASAPLSRTVTCVPNADTPVEFRLTIMRDAEVGFFDVAVRFEDVFCSAKFDCVNEAGGPLELLHNGETRDRTVVMAFACTAGEGEQTWLHLSDVVVECGAPPEQRTYWIDPARVPEGNAGPVAPVFFQTAIYRGQEDLPGVDKCYWNMALGVNEGPSAANCRVRVTGTATTGPLVDGRTPAETIWPLVRYDVPLTDSLGMVSCGAHPLNGGDVVKTEYTGFDGASFAHSWECGSTPPATARIVCEGAIGGNQATFTQSPDGIAVAFGNANAAPDSPRYTLPAGSNLRLSGDCCINPCCAE